MPKDFQNWTEQKQNIQEKENIPYFYEREIWYVSLWVNIWTEQDGKWEDFGRPVIIVKKFNKYGFYGIPLTSIDKSKSKYHLELIGFDKNIRSFAVLSQLKAIDSKRLIEKKWIVSIEDHKKLLQKIKELFL